MKSSWKNLPITGAVLAIAILSAAGVVYWSNVADREQYLQSRNFRLLSVLARQTESLMDNRIRVYAENIDSLCRKELRCGDILPDRWTAWPSQDSLIKDGNPATREQAAGQIRYANSRIVFNELVRKREDFRAEVTYEGNQLQFEWKDVTSKPERSVAVRVGAADALHGVFDPRLEQGAFDTVLLTDATGRVAYVTGRRASELSGMSLTDLPGVEAGTDRIARTAAERRVTLAGTEYRMFMQPCCRYGASHTGGFVVVGLVERQALLDASLAVSPVLVLAGVALVIALLVGWSFLKVALIGSQQRVTRVDVLQLGASAVFGLALATILLLTWSTYARLSADVDAQLAQLANRLDTSLSNEVRQAASQLNGMLRAISENPCIEKEEKSADPCLALAAQWSDGKALPPEVPRDHSAFSAFTLIDTSGTQRIKAAPSKAQQRRVDVSDREYFSIARDQEGLWQLKECPNGCTLEQLWSWTTGKFQVVMSTPTDLTKMPVAALATPMKPLLEPVLPPGFEFAIIDQKGLVQFHSDKQRIRTENLIQETDQDARLQSLTASHGAGPLNTSYWGRPYRAFVRPTAIPGWSIVTLHAKQPSRALVLEWATVALLMQGGYMLLWVAMTIALMATEASWLWPDPRRRPWYRALSIVYVAAFLAWFVVATRARLGTTMILGLLLPPALWGITCLALIPRLKVSEQVKTWSGLCREYRTTAALVLAITAAVPATCFFMLSAEQHLRAYLKSQHIDLAHHVDVVEKCVRPADTTAAMPDYRYERVFYGSQVTCQTAQAPAPVPAQTILSRIEEYLPYFTSASAPLRQLMHQRSDDDAWTSDTREAGRLSVAVAAQKPGYSLSVESPLLPIFGITSLGDEPRLALTATIPLLMLVCIALVAYWVVGYLLHRVVLADVVDPVGTNGHLPTTPGQHALVICSNPEALAERLKKEEDDLLFPLKEHVANPNNMPNAVRQARALTTVRALQRIVIPDIDDKSDDVGVMRRKLAIVEELMREPESIVLLLTTSSKRTLENSVRDLRKRHDESDRWSKVIARLTVVDTRGKNPSAGPPDNQVVTLTTWWAEFRDAPAEAVRYWWTSTGHDRNWREKLLQSEEQGYPGIATFCRELRISKMFNSMSEDQILEELEERAGSAYRTVWHCCDEHERVVLEHVAQYGLTSTTSRRVVRRLLARGLLRKDPELRLMNRSFKRFVLEEERQREVVLLETKAGPSLWDRLRLPLAGAALIGVTFLAATQREAFNATLTMATGLTGLVPMLMKFTNLITQFSPKGTGDQKLNT